jgi:PST family polysaccharide transporter
MTAPSVGRRTAQGVAWSVLGTGGQTVFQFLLFIFLARQLGPVAFGIVGVASVLIDLSQPIGRAGLTEVLIQREDVSEDQASTGFWTSLAIGFFFTALFFLGAGPLARLYDLPSLLPVLRMLSPAAMIFAIGAVYEARIRRAYEFRKLAARNVTATLASGLVAVGLAYAGYGVYSLVWQRLIYVTWLFVAMLVATRWVPRLHFSPSESMVQLGQGWSIAISAVLGTSNQRIIDLIVGYFLGATQLGYLRIAWRALDLLLQVTVQPIISVTLTSLSAFRTDQAGMNRAYLRLVHMTALFVYPLFAGASLLAPDIIRLLFGHKWDASGVPMQILALTGFFVPLVYYQSNALIAAGRMRRVLVVNIVEFALSAACAAAFARYGLGWAATGNLVRFALATPCVLAILRLSIGIPPFATLLAVVRPTIAAAAMSAAVFLVRPHLAVPPLLAIALSAVVGAAVYVGLTLAIDRRAFLELVGLFRRRARA